MNAKIDIPFPARISPAQTPYHLAVIAQCGARCQEMLNQSRSLREVAAHYLKQHIGDARFGFGLTVVNPDALFFNRRGEDGSIISVSLTDLLIRVMRHGKDAASISGAGFYLRHDSLDATRALTLKQHQMLLALLDNFSHALPAWYENEIRDLWRKRVTDPDDPQQSVTVAHSLKEQHRSALISEIGLRRLDRELSEAQYAFLFRIISSRSSEGVCSVAWNVPGARQRELPSVFFVNESSSTIENSSDAVYLLMPGKGIERFDSAAQLREALSQRLGADNPDPHLIDSMDLQDQSWLAQGNLIEPSAWQFKGLFQPMLDAHVRNLEEKQQQDFRFLRRATGLPDASFLEQLERVRSCVQLDEAMGSRFTVLTHRMEQRLEPEWLRNSRAEDKANLRVLEKDQRDRDARVRDLLGITPFDTFAEDQVSAYLDRHLGCYLNPTQVMIGFTEAINLRRGEDLRVTYQRSLLEFAMLGLPDVDGSMDVSPAPSTLHADFSQAFIRTMITELDLHQRYTALLRASYTDPDILRAMAHHRDSALALGIRSAQMQGHVRDDRSDKTVHLLRGDKTEEGSQQRMGSLHLGATGARFRDLIVFEDERSSADRHYVLYAPGAPGGRDFFEFATWRQLSLHVGAWLASEAGYSYVLEQINAPGERRNNVYLSSVRLKPTAWGNQSCVFVPSTGPNFEANLAELMRLKVERTIAAVGAERSHSAERHPEASPARLALLEARIEALGDEFSRISGGLIDFEQYVHQQTSMAINAFLKAEGYRGHVDPDTLYLGLGVPYTDTPDFSEGSQLPTLTQLMKDTRQDILKHRPAIHVYFSTGLDIRALPVNFVQFLDTLVRGADMGAKYMRFLTRDFLTGSPLYGRRRALMAKRVQFSMLRDALKAYVKGDLDPAQFRWLNRMVASLDADARIPAEIRNSSVSAFKIADQIIEGVFIFRDFNTGDSRFNLLYTPDAADGIHFRRVTDYADLLKSESMRNYYYGRVAYKGLRAVSEFFDELARVGKPSTGMITVSNRLGARIKSAELLYGQMLERIITDVDAQTVSLNEQRIARAWAIVEWTVDILLIPFPKAKIVWGIFKSVLTLSQGLDAWFSGDRATALPLLLKGVKGIVTGANDFHGAYGAAIKVESHSLEYWALKWLKNLYALHDALGSD